MLQAKNILFFTKYDSILHSLITLFCFIILFILNYSKELLK